MFDFGKSGCIRDIVVVFVQSGFVLAKWMYSCKNGCIFT